MAGVRTHEDLDVWKLSEELVTRVRPILKRPAVRADFDLHDQLKRAVERICPNIAEGFSRFLPRDHANFIRIAKSSMSEVIVHLNAAAAKGYVKVEEIQVPCRFARRARGAATQFILYLESAKPPNPPEPRTPNPNPGTPEPPEPRNPDRA
jgi:four helix bundle protein